ncbi:LysR family transcriptional regulator [Tenacibaculum caenipelagi]|uniref:LysR family cyn operon transcriptional activator n=1 Tax=Tenacibaculum caenipelagi TaxID=1325435 RepID=A0A4R6TCE1_9FLAO|nr:LysR family transcriptional regulator [Tenacibaculum caenipelagi]TDQ27465.1 LysR family cyn operon transcriptional activator [Tenacibaculum caenipelagi]
MELRQLRYFLKAKELLNFTAAAAELYISQSTLSQQIKQLEIELGVPLFNRIGKRVKLTEAGELFYEYALQSVNSANNGFDLLKDLKNLDTGELKIGATYGMKHIITGSITQFLSLYPKIVIHVIYGTSKELIEKLDNFELDFVLSFQEFEVNKNHKYQFLFDSEMVLIGASDSELNNLKKVKMENLVQFPLALPAKGFSTRQYIDSIIKKKNLELNISLEVNDIPMLLDLVKTGKFFTVLAKTTVQNFNSLISVPIIQPQMVRKGMIISIKDIYEKKAAKEFYKIINDSLV